MALDYKKIADFTPKAMPFRDANAPVVDMNLNLMNQVIRAQSERIFSLYSYLGGIVNQSGSTVFSGITVLSLTASQAVFTNASKALVSNPITGSGSVVMSASPTLTGTAIFDSIKMTGTMAIGASAPLANESLLINSSNLTTASQYGLDSSAVFSSICTTGTSIAAQIITATAAFTMTTGFGIKIFSPNKGAGSSITTVYGLKIEDQSAGGTNFAIRTGLGAILLGDNVRISDATSAVGVNVGFDVRKTNLTSTSQYQVNVGGSFNSAATSVGVAVNAQLITANSSFTMADGAAIHIESPSKGGLNTITRSYGLWIEDQTALGGTTAYAIKTGTGKVSIGDTTDATSSTVAAVSLLGGLGVVKGVYGDSFFLSGLVAKNSFILNSAGANYGFISNVSANLWALGYGTTYTTLGTSALTWNSSGVVTIASRLNINGATDLASWGINVAGGQNISTSSSGSLVSYGVGVPGDTNYERMYFGHNGAGGAEFTVNKGGTGTYRSLVFNLGGSTRLTITSAGDATFAASVTVNGQSNFSGGVSAFATLTGGWYDIGSYTATTTGLAVNQTGTFRWVKTGKIVTLYCVNLTGTSNSTAFTITGMPTDIRPARTQILIGTVNVRNNSSSYIGSVQIATSGVMTFAFFDTLTGGQNFTFTNVNGKGLDSVCTIHYSLD